MRPYRVTSLKRKHTLLGPYSRPLSTQGPGPDTSPLVCKVVLGAEQWLQRHSEAGSSWPSCPLTHTSLLVVKVVLGVRDDKELAKAVKRLEDNGLTTPSLVVDHSKPTPLSYQRSGSSTLHQTKSR